jgi:ParB-like chromosome segregation protein Spo0J
VDQIAASMVEFGWTNPILVDENAGILAGHGRLLAARKLGWPRCLIADNQLALQRNGARSCWPRSWPG